MTSTVVNGITWEESLSLSSMHYENVAGEAKEWLSPSIEYQVISGQLHLRLAHSIHRMRLGVLLFSPLEIVISRDPLRTRQPDLLFISKERGGILANVRRLQRLETAPDLVIEILSPSETKRDWMETLEDYIRIGTREMWLVDPESRTIEVIVMENGHWRSGGVFSGAESVQSLVLPGIELLPADVFED